MMMKQITQQSFTKEVDESGLWPRIVDKLISVKEGITHERTYNYANKLKEEFDKLKVDIEILDQYCYDNIVPALETGITIDTYDRKFMIVPNLNFKKDQFDSIFDFPSDVLTKVERVDEECENEIWSIILNNWKRKQTIENKDQIIACLESMKRILATLLSTENLNAYLNPDNFDPSNFDHYKFMSLLGNINVVIEQF